MNKPKFKIGDRVRECNPTNLRELTIQEIIYYYSTNEFCYWFDNYSGIPIREDNLKLVSDPVSDPVCIAGGHKIYADSIIKITKEFLINCDNGKEVFLVYIHTNIFDEMICFCYSSREQRDAKYIEMKNAMGGGKK